MVYFRSDNIISSLGNTTKENFDSMASDRIGIRAIDDHKIYPHIFPASIIDEVRLEKEFDNIAEIYPTTVKLLSTQNGLCYGS